MDEFGKTLSSHRFWELTMQQAEVVYSPKERRARQLCPIPPWLAHAEGTVAKEFRKSPHTSLPIPWALKI